VRITRLEIAGYGCVRDLQLHFAPGTNCVVGPNECGKSTVITAIVALLYDHARGAQRDNELNDRLRPWSGGRYGGQLDLVVGGRAFRIARDFGVWRTGVYALPGESDVTARFVRARVVDVGSVLLGLDRTLFSALAVIRQRELIFAPDTARQVIALLTGLLEAPGGAPTAAQALGRLAEWLKTEANPGGHAERTSPLLRARADVARLRSELEAARSALESLEQLSQHEQILASEAANADAKLAGLERELAAARAAEIRDRLRRIAKASVAAAEARQQLAALGPSPDSSVVDEADRAVRAAATLADAVEPDQAKRRERLTQLQAEVSELGRRLNGLDESTIDQLASIESKIREAPTTSPPPSLLIPGLLAALLSVVGYLVAGWPGALGGLTIGALAGLALSGRNHVQQGPEDEDGRSVLDGWLERVGAASVTEVRLLVARHDRDTKDLQELADLVERDDRRLADARSIEAKMLTALGISERGQPALDSIRRLRHSRELARDLEQRASEQESLAAALLGSDTVEALETRAAELESVASGVVPESAVADLERAVAEARRHRDQARAAALAAAGELQQRERTVASPALLEAELAVAISSLERIERIASAIQAASARISSASAALRAEIVPDVSHSLAERFAAVTSGRYRRVGLDPVSLAVTAESGDRSVPVDFASLSQGTQDALQVLLRLCLLDRMAASAERAPLILDDPLLSVDFGRAREVVHLLGQIAGERQVLYFTHDERLADLMAVEAGAAMARLPAPTGSRGR